MFFIAQFISLLFFIFTDTIVDYTKITLILLTLSIPIALVSIYYQWRIAKKIVCLCLGIIAVLYTELIVTSFFYFKTVPNSFFINIKAFLYSGISFIIPLFGWLFIKPLITRHYTLQSENKKLFKFKRNYSLFKQSLLAERKIDYKNLESVITIGNKNAKLKISIVTNHLCNFCKKTHLLLEKLLDVYSENIQLNIHFSFLPSKENNNQKDHLHYKLIDIYFTQGKVAFMKSLGDWFKNKDFEKWFSTYGKSLKNKSKIIAILQQQHLNNKNNSILFTRAVFIGEFAFPKIYEREDVLLYIDNLIEDKEILI